MLANSIGEIPVHAKVYVCGHVFDHSRPPMLFARENDGDLVCTCGCDVKVAHTVGFGHLREKLRELAAYSMLEPREYYWRENEGELWEKDSA